MSLKLIIGCMFSGKSSEIIKEANRLLSIDKKVLLINSIKDLRYGKDIICSHNLNKIDCLSVDLLLNIDKNHILKYEYIIIDESQFFPDLYEFTKLFGDSKHLIVVGLNGDSNRNNFGDIYKLYPLADSIKLLKAMCMICKDGTEAIFSKKIIKNNDIIEVGEKDKYIPVCRKCFS
jgi:thymidine kinase